MNLSEMETYKNLKSILTNKLGILGELHQHQLNSKQVTALKVKLHFRASKS